MCGPETAMGEQARHLYCHISDRSATLAALQRTSMTFVRRRLVYHDGPRRIGVSSSRGSVHVVPLPRIPREPSVLPGRHWALPDVWQGPHPTKRPMRPRPPLGVLLRPARGLNP